MTYEELIAAQDRQRTQRSFISLLSGALGVPEQSYANEDSYAINRPGQYTTITPYGQSVEGQPISNLQNFMGLGMSLPMLLLIGGVAYLALKK
ncbi:hypothetical protein [Polaromonas sp. YR568]|uniref:hypothetical protein n=1 Tax=Polaromonas sp. YR568 TaxID=1855301 RepID=UPI003137E592